ncbi:MAG: thioredoxin family protein [Clostridium fessum]
MAELKITAANFENEVLRSDKPILLDFYADWCGTVQNALSHTA